MTVTQDDLLDALRQALAKPSDGTASTVGEMAAATGRGVALVRKALKVVQSEGRLEVVRVRRMALDGRMQEVPGYRIKAKAKR